MRLQQQTEQGVLEAGHRHPRELVLTWAREGCGPGSTALLHGVEGVDFCCRKPFWRKFIPWKCRFCTLGVSPLSSNLLSMNCSFSASPSWEKVRAHRSPSFSTSKIRGQRCGKGSPKLTQLEAEAGLEAEHGSPASVPPQPRSVSP